jgi:hypothetical protein
MPKFCEMPLTESVVTAMQRALFAALLGTFEDLGLRKAACRTSFQVWGAPVASGSGALASGKVSIGG